MQKCAKRLFSSLFLSVLFIITGTVSITPVFAQGKEERIVRVGYYTGDTNFQDGFSDEARKSGYAYEYYQIISPIAGWSYEYIYGTKDEVLDKLVSGEVDIVAGVSKSDKRAGQMLFSDEDMGMEGKKRYFAINSKRADLLEAFNDAHKELLSLSPDFERELQQKYYSHDIQKSLTEKEKAWLEERGSLKIGYMRGNLPLSDQAESGAPRGVVKELLAMLSSYLDVTLQPVCYDSVTLLEEGIRKGEVDAGFPIFSDMWITETKGFFQTEAFISDKVMIVYHGNYRSDLMDKIAISDIGVGQRYYLSLYYPEAEMLYYNTREESFQAMQDDEVHCMIGSASVLQRFLATHTELKDFNIAYLDYSEEFGMAVNKDTSELVGILNKAIRQIDDATITEAMIKYSDVNTPYTLVDFMKQYSIVLVAVLSVFFAILLVLFISFRRKTERFNQEQDRTNAALKDALAAANTASEAKTKFLSSMSHDIRTPMNGIIGMTAIAAAHLDDSSRVEDCLKKITASGKHLLALINEVLDMSKIESGEIYLNEEIFDLSELMEDLLTLNKPQADAKSQELIVHILKVSHEMVVGDRLRLQQIFTNLFSNAIKYTPDGGRIEITLIEKPSGSPKLGCFEFSVKDNGVGMSEEYLPHIFEAFTRANNASTKGTQGTGLGMAIARNIVRMMDGDITVESAVGKGSTFTVTVFLKLHSEDAVSYDDFIDLPILVVDDDQVICESTCILLSELGMSGEWVVSGREAVEKVEMRQNEGMDYFAVLIDWKMPEMDGIAVTREIRRRMGDHVPIIIISAYDWSAIEAEATEAGASGFIGKPLFKSRLITLFEKLLGTEKEMDVSGLNELTSDVDFSGNRALLTEDNEINAEIATEILNMVGVEVEWAHDGKEAVDMMAASAPGYYSCIFMDVQMPVMNGIEATKLIRKLEHDDAGKIPIFAMTANAFAEDVRAVLDAGMNEHIAKPLDFDALINVLKRYL